MSKGQGLFIDESLSKKPAKSTSKLISGGPQFDRERESRLNILLLRHGVCDAPLEDLMIGLSAVEIESFCYLKVCDFFT